MQPELFTEQYFWLMTLGSLRFDDAPVHDDAARND